MTPQPSNRKRTTRSRTEKLNDVDRLQLKNLGLVNQLESQASGTTTLPLTEISLSSSQPRRYFDPDKHQQLVASVKRDGILQPLLVRPKDDGYELVAGERRYRAAQQLALTEVPVTVREISDTEARQLALVENLQREDLNPIDETEGILALLEMRLEREREEVIALLNKLSKVGRGLADNDIRPEESEAINEIFASVGRLTSESFRVNRLPLLNLPQNVLDALRFGKIEYTKAKALAQLKDDDALAELLEEAIEQGLSLNQIRQRVTAMKAPVTEEAPLAEDIQKRVAKVGRLSKRSEALEDPQTRQKVDKLLGQLEKLLAPK
jgi:ParB family chromosome partitioning protein